MSWIFHDIVSSVKNGVSNYRPRHFRKIAYEHRLQEGDACLNSVADLLHCYANILSEIDASSWGMAMTTLEEERKAMGELSDTSAASHEEQHSLLRLADQYRSRAQQLLTSVKERCEALNALYLGYRTPQAHPTVVVQSPVVYINATPWVQTYDAYPMGTPSMMQEDSQDGDCDSVASITSRISEWRDDDIGSAHRPRSATSVLDGSVQANTTPGSENAGDMDYHRSPHFASLNEMDDFQGFDQEDDVTSDQSALDQPPVFARARYVAVPPIQIPRLRSHHSAFRHVSQYPIIDIEGSYSESGTSSPELIYATPQPSPSRIIAELPPSPAGYATARPCPLSDTIRPHDADAVRGSALGV